MKKCNILWFCPITDPSGYGIVSREYLKRLNKYNDLSIRIIPRSFHYGDKLRIPMEERLLFENLMKTEHVVDAPLLTIYHLQPDNFRLIPGCEKHIGMTVFETEGIPEYWKAKMNKMSEIWTFSTFCRDVFKRNIARDIRIIPHGVDTIKYKSGVNPLSKIKECTDGKFVFGSSFAWQPRKNPNGLIESFLREFMDKKEKVCLVIKTFIFNPKYIKNEINKIKTKIGCNHDFPDIFLITDAIEDSDMPRFYNSLDAYALISKGEGFSMSHMEAMACGLPVIGTNWGGNLDFMNRTNSYLVDCKVKQVSKEDASIQPMFNNLAWAEIEIADIQKALRSVYEERDGSIGKKATVDMKEWSWERASDVLYDNIARVMK